MTIESSRAIEPIIDHLARWALQEDLGAQGDVTSQATLPAAAIIRARIVAKSPGVIAGLYAVRAVYAQIDPAVGVEFFVQDGAVVSPGGLVAQVSGNGRAVLAGERTALNFLQHLSGIATLTAKFVAAISGTKAVILDTRKTTPGWRILEKYAVRMGGGQNHRMGLYDAVLIKDNHIDAAGSITAAVKAVRVYPAANGLQIIVEARNRAEVAEAVALNVDQILLDNMTEAQLREAVLYANGRVLLEASGNMRLDRVRAVAETGVDYISVGALTHSAPALDLSMQIVQS